jgi:hypothetical protein
MKKFLLAFALLISFGMAAHSQSNQQKPLKSDTNNIVSEVFTLDVGSPHKHSLTNSSVMRKTLQANWRHPIALQLIHVNPFKYKYSISGVAVDLFTGGVNPMDKAEQLNNGTGTQPTDSLANAQKQIAANVKSHSIMSNLKGSSLIKNSPKIKNMLAIAPDSTDPKTESIQLLTTLQSTADTLLNNLKNYSAEISSEDFLDDDQFKSARADYYNQAETLIKALNAQTEAYNAIPVANRDPNGTTLITNINNTVTSISNIIGTFFQAQLTSYTLDFDVSWKNMDYLQFTVERDDITTSKAVDTYQYNIWASGGLKIDISAGVFVTALKDKEYFTSDDPNTSGNKFITQKDEGLLNFGFGSMINIAYRTGAQWFRPALSIGALFTSNQEFQILSGLGLVLGKEERIIFHGGLAMGYIQELENTYIGNGTVSYNLGTNGQVPMVNRFSTGYFLGFTYNFTKASAPASTSTTPAN